MSNIELKILYELFTKSNSLLNEMNAYLKYKSVFKSKQNEINEFLPLMEEGLNILKNKI